MRRCGIIILVAMAAVPAAWAGSPDTLTVVEDGVEVEVPIRHPRVEGRPLTDIVKMAGFTPRTVVARASVPFLPGHQILRVQPLVFDSHPVLSVLLDPSGDGYIFGYAPDTDLEVLSGFLPAVTPWSAETGLELVTTYLDIEGLDDWNVVLSEAGDIRRIAEARYGVQPARSDALDRTVRELAPVIQEPRATQEAETITVVVFRWNSPARSIERLTFRLDRAGRIDLEKERPAPIP